MKKLDSKTKDIGYFIYRLISPIIDPIKIITGITGYIWFIKDLINFKLQSPKSKLLNMNLFPILNEKVSYTPFDAMYFHQQLWCFEEILKNKPKQHVDVSSTYEMSGYISKITKAIFIDYRPIQTDLDNLEIRRGDILNLDLKSNTVNSLSCLNVAEHIGLGRYGDPIDADGTKKACKELSRVLAPKGNLYFSIPIGRERICFNAHRIFDPTTILKFFKNLKLVRFDVIDDEGNYIKDVKPENYKELYFGCGLYHFTK